MIISLIAAVAENNVIGNKGKIPWYLPKDFQYFKQTTLGHHIIMGQTTFESIGKPLPGRVNIVLTLDEKFKAKGCVIAHNIKQALAIARKAGEKECFIIGGASIYKQTIEMADKLYITKVRHAFEGDTLFPEIDKNKWKLESKKENKKDDKNIYDFDFLAYEQK